MSEPARKVRRWPPILVLAGTLVAGATFFLPWYSVTSGLTTEWFYPWIVESTPTGSASVLRSFARASLPTVGTLYGEIAAALLVVVVGGLLIAGLMGWRGPAAGIRPIFLGLVVATVVVGLAVPAYVAGEQPRLICYDSLNNAPEAIGAPSAQGTSTAPPAECGWVSFASGGEWQSGESAPGPGTSFSGNDSQGTAESWGPSYGWYLEPVGVGLIVVGAGPSLAGGTRPPGPPPSLGERGRRWVAASRAALAGLRARAPEGRSLAGLLVAGGAVALVASLGAAWCAVEQGGLWEQFGPSGIGASFWLGASPPLGFDGSAMPYTGLLYDLVGAAIVLAAVAGVVTSLTLLLRTDRRSLDRAVTLGAIALVLAASTPLAVAAAQPPAVCADFPLGPTGNASLSGTACYWVTQSASGGEGPAPSYTSGPQTGFSGGSSGGVTWGPSLGWFLPFLAAGLFAAGLGLSGGLARRTRPPPPGSM